MEVIIGCGAASVDLVDAITNVVSERKTGPTPRNTHGKTAHKRACYKGLPVLVAIAG